VNCHSTKPLVPTPVLVDRQTKPAQNLWSIAIDPVTMPEAVARVRSWIAQSEPLCRFVVTPNVDHVVLLYRKPELQAMYNNASLTLADGWPLVTMSRWYGKRLPERVAGSDLLPAVCDDFQRHGKPLRLFLLGGRCGVPERAAANIHQRWPDVSVVGLSSPPFGFEHDPGVNQLLCEQINAAKPDLLVVGLGNPKQEIWLNQYRQQLKVPVALAVGGTIDFLAGEQKRAPQWMRSMRLEWLHRLATNPRRLAMRYAVDAVYFPWICAAEKWRPSPVQILRQVDSRISIER
jgi:N-acetylglucosaminyldiphosphoundecaprenol N-acetyl-beta-D-mannosaminyltransferase